MISTITQPIFKVSLYSELDILWPDRSVAWVEGDQKLYILEAGTWIDFIELASANVPRAWLNGTRKMSVKSVFRSGTVAGGAGVVSFDLTDGSGNAVFSNVYKESASFFVDSPISYNFSSYTLAADKKSLSMKISNPILSALVIIYANAANGVTVYLQISGD